MIAKPCSNTASALGGCPFGHRLVRGKQPPDTLYQALCTQDKVPEVQFAAKSPLWRPLRCSTVVTFAFMSEEIEMTMSLTESKKFATRSSEKSDFRSFHLIQVVMLNTGEEP